MAIQFNLNALSRFSNVDFGDNDAIANLDGKDGLKQNKALGSIFTRFRLPSTKERNNAVRTELLKALANAFGIKEGVAVANGKTTFTDKFMSRLEEILGPDFKRGDFGIKDGVVDSGKPLTQRRIQAIVKAARAKGDAAAYDGTTYLAKVDYIKGWIKDKKGLDAATKRAALDFFDVKIRQTIGFLDKEFEGLSYSTAEVKKGGFGKYIKDKTGLCVNVDKIREDLHAESAIKDAAEENNRIVNIDDIGEIADKTSEPVKQKVGELLKALVKQSVDLFIHTMESKHAKMYKAVTDIVSTEGQSVKVTLSRLDNLSGTISRVEQYWEKKERQPAVKVEGEDDVFEENHEEYFVE